MTRDRSHAMGAGVAAALRALAAADPPRATLVCAGGAYLDALTDVEAFLGASGPLELASGPPGRQAARLHDWLHGEPPPLPPVRAGATLRMRGVAVTCTKDELLAAAREAIAARGVSGPPAETARYHAWYVDVDGHRVAPKWLARLATGRPVSAFSTDDARHLLAQLGVEVQRA